MDKTIEKTENTKISENVENVEIEKNLFKFNADMTQLMNLIVNNFYSNKDIFLRELLSNSSDAINKVRHSKLNLGKDSETIDYEIKINLNKEEGILSIEDSGIGMNKTDLLNNIGTIASSGTKKFINELQDKNDLSLIGQFGVGFYSAFLVADKVRILTKKDNENEKYEWESKGDSTFNLIENSNINIDRGTRIELYLKDNCKNYLEESTIKKIVNEHSQYINYPIKLLVHKTRQIEVEENEEEEEDNKSKTKLDDEVEIEELKEEKEEKNNLEKKTIEETYEEWEQLNDQKPIWIKNPDTLSDEDYKNFYKDFNKKSYGLNEYYSNKHFSIEGHVSVKGILYIPKSNFNPFMMKENDGLNNIKLYVKRVFLSDNCKDLIPHYLNFVKGIVDCEDLPLTVSREMLQESKSIEIIRKVVIKQILTMFIDLQDDTEKYEEFYKEYSKNIKAGYHEDEKNRQKYLDLFRFYSSKSTDKLIKLDDYVTRMKEGQSGIYYIAGENVNILENSPYIEKLKSNDIEVLYFTETIDEYISQILTLYKHDSKEIKFICINKDNLELGDKNDEKEKDNTNKYEKLCNKIQEVLTENLEKVIVSDRIVDSPCCLVCNLSANMERIMKSQPLENVNNFMLNRKKTLEININHPIITGLNKMILLEKDEEVTNELICMLYDTSCLNSGYSLRNANEYSKRIYKLLDNGINDKNIERESNSDNTTENIEKENNLDNTTKNIEKENNLDNTTENIEQENNLDNTTENIEQESNLDNTAENIEQESNIDDIMNNIMKNGEGDSNNMINNIMKNIDETKIEDMMKNINPEVIQNMMKSMNENQELSDDSSIDELKKEVSNLEKEISNFSDNEQ